METRKQRAFGPDLVRAAAVLLVLSVHFFLNSGFYDQPLQGRGMLLSAVIRMACMTCVPLFLMLTGYLCCETRWSGGYYRRLIRVVLSYLLAGGACVAFRILWMKETLDVRGILRLFFSFNATPYAWYIEMYIGLFLLTPFLGAAWGALSRRARGALVVSLLCMTALPATLNAFVAVVPDWWVNIYPLTYFFLGAWLRTYPAACRGGWLVMGWAGFSAAAALVVRLMVGEGKFPFNTVNNWNSLFVVGESVCLFALLSRCSGERWPAPLRAAVSWLARVSLELYLLSYIGDRLLYPRLLAAGLTPGKRLLWMPVIVAANILLSGAMGQLLHWIVGLLYGLCAPRKKPAPAGGEKR